MSTVALRTAACEALGARYPIVQTAMGYVATPELVAASCNAGAFGILACATLAAPEVAPAIDRVRALTDRPFGVNFHMFQPGAAQIVDTILEKRVRAVSFGRGPDAAMIARFRAAGLICIASVGALRHAQKSAELGADMLIVQGGEGGGHTGSVATTVLLPQVLDAVKIPVFAAGGFADGRGLAAALACGAAGVAMGTRFLMTRESPVPGCDQGALRQGRARRRVRHDEARRHSAPDAPQRARRADRALERRRRARDRAAQRVRAQAPHRRFLRRDAQVRARHGSARAR